MGEAKGGEEGGVELNVPYAAERPDCTASGSDMATIGLVITSLAFLVSLLFNLLQLKWRKDEQAARADDKAEQKRKDDERETGQRLKEQAAPLFFNRMVAFGKLLIRKVAHPRGVLTRDSPTDPWPPNQWNLAGSRRRLSALGLRRDPHGSVKQIHHEELEDGDKERPSAFPKIMLKQTDSGIQ